MRCRLRLGVVAYLNTKGLSGALEAGLLPDVEVVSAVPSRLGALLNGGQLDAALLSSVLAVQPPFYQLVPGAGCVAAHGAIQSVQLFTKRPLSEVQSVALDTSSLCAARLTRALCRLHWGVDPQFVPHSPDLPAMLDVCDAALLIGDPGLARYVDGYPAAEAIDLGQAWWDWTGLPFVFAAWLSRDPSPELGAVLERARLLSQAHLPHIVEEESQRLHLPPAVIERYLSEVVHTDYGADEEAGLQRFGQVLRQLDAGG